MNDRPDQQSETPTESSESKNWFNHASRSSILNALWLGPVNIFLWFKTGRFDGPEYLEIAEEAGTDLDGIIAITLVFEILAMIFSLFVVSAVFHLAKANESVFTFIMFAICATLLWIIISMTLGL